MITLNDGDTLLVPLTYHAEDSHVFPHSLALPGGPTYYLTDKQFTAAHAASTAAPTYNSDEAREYWEGYNDAVEVAQTYNVPNFRHLRDNPHRAYWAEGFRKGYACETATLQSSIFHLLDQYTQERTCTTSTSAPVCPPSVSSGES